jgi:hypothetical protein
MTLIQPALLIYVANTKLAELESMMASSKMISDAKLNWQGAGLIGRLGRLSMMFSCLLLSKLWIKRGLVDAQEIANLPKSLILWVLIPGISTMLVMPMLYFYPEPPIR